ncbi:hypothetical protein Clacol_001694 [Clathrus columnatus]|uniref:CST complex subunit Stn1 N-terminal domain-containing protein n=1 Tax=Clathrus columnatus TaxID=1419009 RepID=A0AAV5A1L6_9AGAM|nr:hypothetical protein Clacol_001694 [Clathrus columnatus]
MAPSNDKLQWFFGKDSIAQCFIQDIHTARISYEDNNFFWYLGTVPFRVVRFVGIVIGVKTYERRNLFNDGTVKLVDDGTATIQCINSHPVVKPRSIVNKLGPSSDPPASTFVKPLCDVGDTVRIVGRVESWRDTRQINIEHLGMYFFPFTVPSPSSMNTLAEPPKKDTIKTSPTPHVVPASKTVLESIIVPEDEPLKLRHPSRLRSKELSKNVFKIYLKNYMDTISHSSRCSYRRNINFDPLLYRLVKGFRLSHLRRVPELATLGKRVIHFLNTTTTTTTTSNEHVNRLSVEKLFVWAIKELIKEGTLVLHDGNVWETANHQISVWRTSQSDDSRISRDNSIMKNSTNISRYIEEDTEELSNPSSKEESYISLSPEILCPSLLNTMKELTKSKGIHQSEDTNNLSRTGFSVRDIRHHLTQDMRWEYVGDYIIADTLHLLERKSIVQSVNNEWKLKR